MHLDGGTLKVKAAFRTLGSAFDSRAWIASWIRSSVSILSVLVVVMVVILVVYCFDPGVQTGEQGWDTLLRRIKLLGELAD